MSFTPSVTFNRYEYNSGTVSPTTVTVTGGTLDGYSADKYIYNVVVPYIHSGSVNIPTIDFYFDLAKNTGNENVYLAPMSSGQINQFERLFNHVSGSFDNYTWVSGTTTVKATFDISGGYSGSRQTIGTSPIEFIPWFSGTAYADTGIMDIPSIWQGSVIAMVQPTDWDGDSNNYIHDFQMIQLHTGFDVRVSSFTGTGTGYYQDDYIMYPSQSISGTMILNVFHFGMDSYEVYKSGTTLIDSGSLTYTPDDYSWQTIEISMSNGLNYADDEWYELRLYGNGSISHPTPLRTVTIRNIFAVNAEQSGRFGIGTFGSARFGLD